MKCLSIAFCLDYKNGDRHPGNWFRFKTMHPRIDSRNCFWVFARCKCKAPLHNRLKGSFYGVWKTSCRGRKLSLVTRQAGLIFFSFFFMNYYVLIVNFQNPLNFISVFTNKIRTNMFLDTTKKHFFCIAPTNVLQSQPFLLTVIESFRLSWPNQISIFSCNPLFHPTNPPSSQLF